jgi:hypothetical protein
MLDEMRMYARFALGLRGFLRQRIGLGEAHERLRRRLADREDGFLRIVERAVFENPESPYRPLFQLAGCTLADLRREVKARGLEPALERLQEAGVYVGHEEFKGGTPLVRQGREIPLGPHAFRNPYLPGHYHGETGGSTGVGRRVTTDLARIAANAGQGLVRDEALGLLGRPKALWRPPLPDASGVNMVLNAALTGNVPRRWFTPVSLSDLKPPLRFRVAQRSIETLSRLYGVPFPRPEPVPIEAALRVARWAAEAARAEDGSYLSTTASLAVRVSAAACAAGLDLNGVTLAAGSEPLTAAKAREIERSGARAVSPYYLSEAGAVGFPCARPSEPGDVHLLRERIALVRRPREVAGVGRVEALLLTGLLPSESMILINVETDDCAVVEARRCGCRLEELGYDLHLKRIRSYRKLTGEGVTLLGGDLLRVLEEVLPARFGGNSTDYQLVEREDEGGLTRVDLLVSPRVPLADEGAVRTALLDAVASTGDGGELARAMWERAGTLRVRREEPVFSARGKLLPLQHGGPARRAS